MAMQIPQKGQTTHVKKNKNPATISDCPFSQLKWKQCIKTEVASETTPPGGHCKINVVII